MNSRMAPLLLAGLGVLLGAARWLPEQAVQYQPATGQPTTGHGATAQPATEQPTMRPAAGDVAGDASKVMKMASEAEIAQAEAELKAVEQELQGKLTRSIPGGVKLASPEVGMELKRLREEFEAKRQRLESLRKN